MIQYIANCTDSFDSNDGECWHHLFTDVSDFANKEEIFRDRVENGEDGFIDPNDFNNIVGQNSIVKENFECYFYPERNNIYVAYDPENDIHYFFGQ